MKQNSLKWVAAALFCCFLWGSAPVLIKTGYSVMNITGTWSIILFAGLRFFLAGLMVLIYYSFSKKGRIHLPQSALFPIVCLAFFQTFGQYFCYYIGVANCSGVIASILSGASCFFALILSAWIYRLEKMTALKAIGCFLGFAGIVIMNMKGLTLSFSLAGEGMMILSQISSAESAVLIQIFSKKNDPVLLSGAQFTLGGAALIALGFFMGGRIAFNPAGLIILTALAFVSAGAYTIWGILLSRYPVSKISIFTCTIPLFGVLFSVLFLHETSALTIQTLISMLCITAGIFVLNRKSGKEKAETI